MLGTFGLFESNFLNNGKKFLDIVLHVSAIVSSSPQKQDVQPESNNENSNHSSDHIKLPMKSVIGSSDCRAQKSSKSVVLDSPS